MLRRYSGGFQADRTALAHTAEGTITITISEADTNTVRFRVTGIIFIPISTEYTEFPTVVVEGQHLIYRTLGFPFL